MTAIDHLRQAILARNLDDDTFRQYAFWLKKIYQHLKITASQWTGANCFSKLK
jgi:hypothetical protein